MKERKTDTVAIAYIAIFLALLIAGGFAVYQVAVFVPLPGMKYILMAPYISCVLYLLQVKVKVNYVVLKFSISFALVMILVNLFMALAILMTGILTEVFSLLMAKKYRSITRSILFSTFTPMTALILSKYLVGGIFLEITLEWVMLASIIGLILGVLGVYVGRKLKLYLRLGST